MVEQSGSGCFPVGLWCLSVRWIGVEVGEGDSVWGWYCGAVTSVKRGAFADVQVPAQVWHCEGWEPALNKLCYTSLAHSPI